MKKRIVIIGILLLMAAFPFIGKAADFIDDCDDFSKIYEHSPINETNSWQEGVKLNTDAVIESGSAIMSTSIGGRPHITYKMDDAMAGFCVDALLYKRGSGSPFTEDFTFEVSRDGSVWETLTENVKSTEKTEIRNGWYSCSFYCEELEDDWTFLKITWGDSTATGVRYGAIIDRVVITPKDDVYKTNKALVFESLTDEAQDSVIKSLNLPRQLFGEVTISWESSAPEVLAEDGSINADGFVGYSIPVTLTANIMEDGTAVKTKTFELVVRRDVSEFTDEDYVDYDLSHVCFEDFCMQPADMVIADIILPSGEGAESAFVWSVSNEDMAEISNYLVHFSPEKNQDVKMNLILSATRGEVTKSKQFPITVLRQYSDNLLAQAKLTASSAGVNKALSLDVTSFWETSQSDTEHTVCAEFSAPMEINSGLITQCGEQAKSVAVRVSQDKETWSQVYTGALEGNRVREFFIFQPVQCKYIEIVFSPVDEPTALYNLAFFNDICTAEQAVAYGIEALTIPLSVKEDISLPLEGEYGGVITWTSDNEAVITSSGKITRLANKSQKATLTATLTLDGETAKKNFTVTVAGQVVSGGASSSSGSRNSGGSGATFLPYIGEAESTPQEKKPEDTPAKPLYTDVESAHWARPYIDALCESGALAQSEHFRPEDAVLREEFLKMLCAAAGVEIDGKECGYTDVEKSEWYYSYIAAAHEMNIVQGKDDGSFGIGESITRQDAAVMAYRLLLSMGCGLPAAKEADYRDVRDIADYAREAIFTLTELEIVNGDQNQFDPQGSMTRAQSAKIVLLIRKCLEQRQ